MDESRVLQVKHWLLLPDGNRVPMTCEVLVDWGWFPVEHKGDHASMNHQL